MFHISKKTIAGFSAIMLLLVLFFVNCGQSTESAASHPVALEFMEYLTQRTKQFEGFKIDADLGKSQVKKIQGNRYLITLKNITFTANTAAVLKLFLRSFAPFLQDDAPGGQDVVDIEEAAVEYDNAEKSFSIKYVKGIKTDRDLSKLVHKDYKVEGILGWAVNWNLKRARLYLSDITFKKFDSDILLLKGQSTDRPIELPEAEITGIRMNFDVEGGVAVELRVGSTKSIRQGNTNNSFGSYIMQKNISTLDIADFLAKGLPFTDSHTEYGEITLEVTKNGIQLAKATLGSFSNITFLGIEPKINKQEEQTLAQREGYALNRLHLTFQHPTYKTVTVSLEKGEFIMSLLKINPGVIAAFADFFKKSIELRDSADEPSIRRYMKMKGKQYFAEMTDSSKLGTEFTINIDALKVTCPGNRTLETLWDIRECSLRFGLETDNPKIVAPFLKPSPGALDTMGSESSTILSSDILMTGRKYLPVLMQSGLRIKYAASPFKHYFGELSIKTRFTPKPLAVWSQIKIKKINDFFNKLTNSGLVPLQTLMMLRQVFMGTAAFDTDGNASIEFEIKAEEPQVVYLNGRRIPVPMSMLKGMFQQMPNIGIGQ